MIYKGADGKFYFTGPAKEPTKEPTLRGMLQHPQVQRLSAIIDTHGEYSTIDPVTKAAVRTNDPKKVSIQQRQFFGGRQS